MSACSYFNGCDAGSGYCDGSQCPGQDVVVECKEDNVSGLVLREIHAVYANSSSPYSGQPGDLFLRVILEKA